MTFHTKILYGSNFNAENLSNELINFPKIYETYNQSDNLPKINSSFISENTSYSLLGLESFNERSIQEQIDEILLHHQFARYAYQEIPSRQLDEVCFEAIYLIKSRLFPKYITPIISIDPYGEITFSHSSNKGYVDIGVNGTRELSYHVRNDLCPEMSIYDDYDWIDYQVPIQLKTAINNLYN